jgi:uncharacterized ubiquitin-like protein YukD
LSQQYVQTYVLNFQYIAYTIDVKHYNTKNSNLDITLFKGIYINIIFVKDILCSILIVEKLQYVNKGIQTPYPI